MPIACLLIDNLLQRENICHANNFILHKCEKFNRSSTKDEKRGGISTICIIYYETEEFVICTGAKAEFILGL